MTSIAYPDSAVTIKSAVSKVKAGQRMPYFVFSNGKNIYDSITVPGFKLLYFGKAGQENFEIVRSIKLPVSTFSFTEIPSVFSGSDGLYVLLRPDNHISYIGKEVNRCMEFMERVVLVI